MLLLVLQKKGVSVAVKAVILLFVIGVLLIVVSLVLLIPGSSEIIAELLKLDW